jgi:hypothetical protein
MTYPSGAGVIVGNSGPVTPDSRSVGQSLPFAGPPGASANGANYPISSCV